MCSYSTESACSRRRTRVLPGLAQRACIRGQARWPAARRRRRKYLETVAALKRDRDSRLLTAELFQNYLNAIQKKYYLGDGKRASLTLAAVRNTGSTSAPWCLQCPVGLSRTQVAERVATRTTSNLLTRCMSVQCKEFKT
jgi:hypothetical protein